MATRVLIVDDHAGFRRSARRMLEAEGYEVVGEAESGAAGLEAAADFAPDVVLLDVQLPDADGVEICDRFCARRHPPTVVLTSTRDGSDLGPRLALCGAAGFIAKSELTGESLGALLDSSAASSQNPA